VNAKATLEFIHPVRESINQVREVNMQIQDELGMDHEQFSQMVVLPQGDFASFLHASTEKRREVLESIFKTYFFDKIKEHLDEKSKDVQEKFAKFDSTLNHHLQNLESEWHEQLKPYDFQELNDIILDKNLGANDKKAALAKVVTLLRPDSKADFAAKKVLEKEISPLQASLVKLEESKDQISKKANLEEQALTLTLREDDIKEIDEKLNLFSKLSPLKTFLESIAIAEKQMGLALNNIDEDYQDLTVLAVKNRIKKLNADMPGLTTRANEAEGAGEKVEELEEKLMEVEDIEEAIKALPKLEKELANSELALNKANEKLKQYRKKQNGGAVSEAAKLLKKNQPCPVCGAREHPKPAKAGTFDFEQLGELELEKENAESNRNIAKLERDSAFKLSKRNFSASSELKKQIAKYSKIADSEDEIIELYESVQAELETLNDSQEFFILFEAAKNTLSTAQKRVNTELSKFNLTKTELDAILKIDEGKLSKESSSFKLQLSNLKSLLAQDSFTKLPKEEKLAEEIEKLAEKIQVLSDQLTEVNARIAIQDGTNRRIEESSGGILETLDKENSLRASSDATLKLKDWVSGKNTAGLSLTNFVLQERLEMILDYASRHLRRMSNGKYEFRLFEEKQGRSQKAGLGITIMDYFAGKERPAETLSGGETFYASLALALGLVEVVKADNGGIELGTLFIDEGFGSLSDDTLEEVIDVLEDLRAERIIGIISHVEGMKTQIPIRLEVRPTPGGPSNVRVAIAGMK
jgi:exonuclease SbcC